MLVAAVNFRKQIDVLGEFEIDTLPNICRGAVTVRLFPKPLRMLWGLRGAEYVRWKKNEVQ